MWGRCDRMGRHVQANDGSSPPQHFEYSVMRGRAAKRNHLATRSFLHIALAAGAPCGGYAMGGALPGQFPLALRIAALGQAALIAGMAVIVMSRAGLIYAGWSGVSRWLVWFVVAVTPVRLMLNLITPSAGERALWAPVLSLLLASSTVVAIKDSLGRFA
jgi:hypothetical protein